ncbi:RNA polymerase sigma factor [Leeuwenhoekiella marinoflava]|uniref:RNA polymerase sigma factor (Sigma-70 family) n=2 Tax=Leeuwenhoekiella marinoflava TaxID=988 RepID=A0A4Q0PKH2_9FLAO|nr:sigma-70 family RNA polymerase sigma factor [Leeuwenhoekiella marinoflava]RXG28453.1 RNA polymerase sigma factor (sigma-70 family) [Leeuwenhoekiella marinoflava]SHF52204.1 RNA polymerase sigma factor, sigma-70 family [Leeuwenhoekiella marinoflava DSM 3653]
MKRFQMDIHYKAFKNGCSQAFNAIYEQYHRRIYWMGRSLIKDVFVVETLVQDTFLILWDKRELIESPKHLVNFLYTVISSECKWYYARPKNQFDRDFYALDNFPNYQDYMLGYDPATVDDHLNDQQKKQKEYEQVVNILPLLGTQRKRLIELCFQHGFKYKTLSEQLGISITETRITMQKTITEIKTILNQGYILKTDQTREEQYKPPVEITKQEAHVLELRCQQHYSFAQIANELNLSQKEVHRAFTTAFQFLQQQHDNQLQSA